MAPVGSCGRRAMGLLPRRCLVRKGLSVASGSVREFERTGGREPRVAARAYSEVAGRPADAPPPPPPPPPPGAPPPSPPPPHPPPPHPRPPRPCPPGPVPPARGPPAVPRS